jgi:hypothetical protein
VEVRVQVRLGMTPLIVETLANLGNTTICRQMKEPLSIEGCVAPKGHPFGRSDVADGNLRDGPEWGFAPLSEK